MVSNTIGAWVKDGETDQITSVRRVIVANSSLPMVCVRFMGQLLSVAKYRFCCKVSPEAQSSKVMLDSDHSDADQSISPEAARA